MTHEEIMAKLKVGTLLDIQSVFFKPKGLYEIVKIGDNYPYGECIWLQQVGKSGKLLKPISKKTFFAFETYDITSAIRCGIRGDCQRITII